MAIRNDQHGDDEYKTTDRPAWCEVDDCPSTICNGPHVRHTCPNGDVVTQRYDNELPCPFCGKEAAMA